MAVIRSKLLKRKTRPSGRDGGGMIVGILIGLMLGALLAAGAAWYLTRSSSMHLPQIQAPKPNNQLSARPGEATAGRKDFEFYRILPQGQEGGASSSAPGSTVNAPAKNATTQTAATALRNASVLPPNPQQRDRLYLQVGAFENPDEADNMKALLALNGIDAAAQRTQLDDGRIVHRVRIGPFDSTEEMGPVRSRLATAGLTASVIRVKP